jgi:hypothetical protein
MTKKDDYRIYGQTLIITDERKHKKGSEEPKQSHFWPCLGSSGN